VCLRLIVRDKKPRGHVNRRRQSGGLVKSDLPAQQHLAAIFVEDLKGRKASLFGGPALVARHRPGIIDDRFGPWWRWLGRRRRGRRRSAWTFALSLLAQRLTRVLTLIKCRSRVRRGQFRPSPMGDRRDQEGSRRNTNNAFEH